MPELTGSLVITALPLLRQRSCLFQRVGGNDSTRAVPGNTLACFEGCFVPVQEHSSSW